MSCRTWRSADSDIRADNSNNQHAIEQRLSNLANEFNQRDGIKIKIHGSFHSPPKPLDPRSSKLFDLAIAGGKEIGMNLKIHPSGGACDGNRLAAAGLPTIDTLGPRGGNLHSEQEYVLINSLPERAKLQRPSIDESRKFAHSNLICLV